jgi:acetoin:2,6-dichlorophenolindophenol oxidoreductase subunit alpha
MTYSKELLKNLYQTMVRIRLFEESLVEPIMKGEIRTPCHLYSGQEAIAAGIGAALKKEDYIFGTHRSHGHFLAKGGDIREMVAEIFCSEKGCSRGRGGSMHIIDPEKGMLGSVPIVAGTISLALGAALASSIRKDNRVTISFFGDGAAGEGVLYESLNFASLKKLPLIFVCENNFYSTHMPIQECRVEKDIYRVAWPFSIPSRQVDGMDVLEVYRTAREAIDQCRKGKGPIFLECLTYRFRGHVGPDDNIQGNHTDIRPKAEVEAWIKRDPISRFEKYLIKNKIFKKDKLEGIKTAIAEQVNAGIRIAKNSKKPSPKDLTRYVFK